jgi:hypothetical protein
MVNDAVLSAWRLLLNVMDARGLAQVSRNCGDLLGLMPPPAKPARVFTDRAGSEMWGKILSVSARGAVPNVRKDAANPER